MSHGNYLDCGCYIDESGHRAFCPSCDSAYLLRGRIPEAPRFTCWVYKQSEPGLWTVGHYDPAGNWYTDSDHDSRRDASMRAAILNGYNRDEVLGLVAKCAEVAYRVKVAAGLIDQAAKAMREWIEFDGGCDHSAGICCCDEIHLAEALEVFVLEELKKEGVPE